MDVGYGLIACQLAPGDPRGWSDLYREAVELAVLAEEVGLDSVWTTEHHFVDDGYMPSLLVTSAAIAARTRRIRIGTGVVLAPLHDPIRLAEDAATVALLSGDRLILGLGLGWSEVEFAAFGADIGKRGKAMEEILAVLPQAWSGAALDHDGPMYAMPRIAVRPVPDRPIPIWIGGNADAAIRRAARLAEGFFSNALPERFAEQIAVAEEARIEIGRESPFTWAHYAICYVADEADRGWEEIRDHIRLMTWKYSDMEASATRRGPLPVPPPMTADEEAALRRRVLVGPADEIARQILALRNAVATDFHLVARSYFPGMPFSRQQEQVRRLGEELAPLLRRG
jgi:alkanesulfonate monooxygenase SsuD/methylene tetrahydromethanopterin reductase-like flavin-dependent oxidoreductase (luciferase family)